MRRWWQQLGVFVALAVFYFSPVTAETWSEVLPLIRRRFPGVRQLSTKQLADWLAAPGARGTPRLIDARTAEEFAVSQLREARRAVSVDDVKALGIRPEEPIVVYCSVGYRSSELASRLAAAGFTEVFNLEGSIFAWANEGRPVYRGTNRVEVVHPFDKKWGQLLQERWHPPVGGEKAQAR